MRQLLAALALLGLALPGCAFYSTVYSYDGPKILTTAPGLGDEARVVGRFQEHDRQFYLLYGLFPVGTRVNGAQLAADALGEHDAAINLKMSDGQNLADMFITYLPCVMGLLCGSWSTWVEGDVVDLVGPGERIWVKPDVRQGERVGPASLPASRDPDVGHGEAP